MKDARDMSAIITPKGAGVKLCGVKPHGELYNPAMSLLVRFAT
jgi:hypothetical protein